MRFKIRSFVHLYAACIYIAIFLISHFAQTFRPNLTAAIKRNSLKIIFASRIMDWRVSLKMKLPEWAILPKWIFIKVSWMSNWVKESLNKGLLNEQLYPSES